MFERDNIRKMLGYASGEQPRDPATIKLNTNENPWPPSPKVAELIRDFSADGLRQYPPAYADGFRHAAADLHGLAVNQVIATRGGDELLRLVITTFVEPDQVIGMMDPSYSLYPVLAQVQACPVFNLPMSEDWQLPANLADEMNRQGARLCLIVNPHAPSGSLTPVDTLRELAARLDGLLLIDEAYIDFAPAGCHAIDLVREMNNVIILRSLSKGYSLAGMRLGYGLACSDLIAPMLHKTKDSYNLDALGQLIAEAALRDQAHAGEHWKRVMAERARLREALADLGLTSPPSAGNFLLAQIAEQDSKSAAGLYEYLKSRQVLVRYFDHERLRDKLRISIGTPEENNELLKLVNDYLA